MQENLTNREKEVLKYIVENFIKYALPIGSRAISKQTDLNLSSATIRNVMRFGGSGFS
jgi:heat-inducible transcriptional repressor